MMFSGVAWMSRKSFLVYAELALALSLDVRFSLKELMASISRPSGKGSLSRDHWCVVLSLTESQSESPDVLISYSESRLRRLKKHRFCFFLLRFRLFFFFFLTLVQYFAASNTRFPHYRLPSAPSLPMRYPNWQVQ
jgi:hypothetical protein